MDAFYAVIDVSYGPKCASVVLVNSTPDMGVAKEMFAGIADQHQHSFIIMNDL